MESTVLESSGVRREIEFSLTKVEYDAHFSKTLREAQKEAQLKGFRKGMVPLNLVKQLYGKQLEAEAMEEAAQESFRGYAEQVQPRIVGIPAVTELRRTDDGGLYVKIGYEIYPEFELGQYKGLQAQRIFHTVTGEEVDTELDNLRERLATLEPAESADDDDHVVTVDIQKLADGLPVIGETSRDIRIFLKHENVNPELRRLLRGTRVGDAIRVDLPTGDGGQTNIPYEVTVKEVNRAVLPDADNTLAMKVLDDTTATIDQLREQITLSIKHEYDSQYSRIFRDSVVAALVNSHDFDVPHTMTHMVLDSFVEDLKQRDKKKELPAGFDRKKFESEMHPTAERTAKWMLIREQIIEAEGITVEEADYEDLAEFEAKRMGIQYDIVLRYLKSLDTTQERIVAEKVMVLLEDYADAQEIEDIVLKQQEEAKATPNGEDGVGQQQEGAEADSDEGSTIKL
ncbi:MAG: trigger factor [Armatimonadetes bacterium]|nr:trigger factor [Armatimonadota bacterium]